MTTTPSRALVLGGGGVAGIAWESGLLAGLLQAGIDLDAADLVVGTSAGSSVAVSLRDGRLTPERLAERFAATSPAAAARPAHLAEDGTATADGAPGRATPAQEVLEFDGIAFFEAMREAARGGGSEQEVRARIGEWARRTPVSTPLEAWLARIGARLPKEWPQGRLAVTAVDAEDGALRTFGAEDGVDLVHAVAASCTVPSVFPLVPIEGRLYMDGGMRSTTNADVAAGHDRVLVVSCAPEGPAAPHGPVLDVAAADLRDRGSQVLVVQADEASLRAFGTNVLDPATSEPSFRAGFAQAQAVGERVRSFWAG